MNTKQMYKEYILEKLKNNELWAIIDYKTYLEMISKVFADKN